MSLRLVTSSSVVRKMRLIVGGPGHGGDAGGGVGEGLSVAQIFHLQPVLAEAGEIDGVGEQVVVVADGEAAEADKFPVLAEHVEVEQNFFGRFHAAFAAALYGILLALFGSRVVEVLAAARGDGEVGLLDVPQHLLVDGVAEGLQIGGHGLGVGVLRFEVFDDLGIRLLAQPEVRIDHGCPVTHLAVFVVGRDGWCRSLGMHGSRRKEPEYQESPLGSA